jgi:hypothetical protein
MSIAILTQVYDEVRRLAIAGSAVAPGDFRLKKLVPSLEQAGKKSPVFAKVAEATTALIDSTEKTASIALLELGTLINSILYTQGETGSEGTLEPIITKDFGLAKTQTSAKLLKPLLEALTSTGPGRMEIIRDAHERGLFRDLRLIRPAIAALDDSYSEIAEFIANDVLPIYGTAIIPELEAQFDPKGKAGQPRRLQLMHRLSPDVARRHVQVALEDGSKEIRVAAIGCLGTSPEDLTFLLEQSKSKAKDVRAAAYMGLSRLPDDQAVRSLISSLGSSDLEIAIESLQASRSPEVLAAILAAAESQVKHLVESKEKDKTKTGKEVTRLLQLLQCLARRDDKATEQLMVGLLDHRNHWLSIKSEPGGVDILEFTAAVLANGSKVMQQALVAIHSELPVQCLAYAFDAACHANKPNEVFTLFSPYLSEASANKKKGKDPIAQKSAEIVSLICNGHSYRYRIVNRLHLDQEELDVASTLSPKWLELAIKLQIEPLILKLAEPGNKASNTALTDLWKSISAAKAKDASEFMPILRTMIRVSHPEAVDLYIATIEKAAKSTSHYGHYWLLQSITDLPKEQAVPKLEALIPKLPEKFAEYLIDRIVELKQK